MGQAPTIPPSVDAPRSPQPPYGMIHRWPDPADPAAAQRLTERFAALGYTAFAERHGGALAALGGNSPFLSDLTLREPSTLIAALADAGQAFESVLSDLRATPAGAARTTIAAALRRAKRQAALIVAVADLGGAWPLHRITGALTTLAEATLRLALQHLLLAARGAREITLPHAPNADIDPEAGCGVVILGMGKLGAGELNYSSDIDLIILYDPVQHATADGPSALFTRMARNLVALMEARDADGYVFRTDLRLRPDPSATPPAVSLATAIPYYEAMGQNWERAAMTKARPIAGDTALGFAFLEAIRPFIWRRGLDFAAIADIGAMKHRIDAHRPATTTALAGLDVKLAPGGIREIEFVAQTLQLVWGGRAPGLRDRTTVGALRRLVGAGRLERRVAAELIVAYRVLRTVEHRLQMVADRQTHSLPEGDALDRFAVFLGCADQDALGALLRLHMGRVRRWYAHVFADVPAGADTLDLTGTDVPAATTATLHAMGFRYPASMVDTLRGWQSGRLRALRTGRARELMDAVLPSLLPALGRQPDPDAAFARFDSLLARLPAGVGLLSMLTRNPPLLTRIAGVLGASPHLADYLAEVPSALEGLIDPGPGLPDPAATLRHQLLDARTLEDQVGITRRMVRAEDFRLCVAQMEGVVDVDVAGTLRTALADAALKTLLPAVLSELAVRHGWVRGGAMAVVALGKAGGREMMAGSDLDVMLVYSIPTQAPDSDGARPIPASQWYTRAAHAYVAALTARGPEGPLYDVDMRLRPSGNKGPVAVSLPAFVRYHAESAWTWERMALTRARVVAGSPAIRARVNRAIANAVARGSPTTRADAAAMRGRLLRDLPATSQWDVKLRPGGGIEVEFVAQTLQLVHGAVPGGQCTRVALAGLGAAGHLPEWAELIAADRLWRTIQSIIRITAGRGATTLLPAAEAAVARAAGLDLAALPATVADVAAQVRAAFIKHVGIPS